jgi:3-mercaptopyruvate sulfurtransferase SseA
MKIHLTLAAMLALGLSFGCTAETSDAASKSNSQPTAELAAESGNPEATPVSTPSAYNVENVDAASAAKLIAENDEVIILDIRTPAEFQSGHLKGAVNIDYLAEDYAEKLGELDKEKTYLVH